MTKLPPLIFNVFKPHNMLSYDVVRYFKKNLPPGIGKIGHFGTLDRFACGVLMIGVSGACRLNNYIHQHLPKTYLAVGKLGFSTETGDLNSEITNIDKSLYLNEVISSFSTDFLDKTLSDKFLGDYWQSPPKYSASKFQGRALHKWARDGIEIKKEPVNRFVYSLNVVKYRFPFLVIRAKVSSGTYIRTLFQDCANFLGTHGTLIALIRESVGHITVKTSIKRSEWPILGKDCKGNPYDVKRASLSPDQVLPLEKVILYHKQATNFTNGMPISLDESQGHFKRIKSNQICSPNYNWVYNDKLCPLGLALKNKDRIKPMLNFS